LTILTPIFNADQRVWGYSLHNVQHHYICQLLPMIFHIVNYYMCMGTTELLNF